jgi:hypothetical protein
VLYIIPQAFQHCALFLQTEIVGRYPHYLSLRDRGEKLISQKHISTDEVQKMVNKLEKIWNELNDTWESRKLTFTQHYDLQVRKIGIVFFYGK